MWQRQTEQLITTVSFTVSGLANRVGIIFPQTDVVKS